MEQRGQPLSSIIVWDPKDNTVAVLDSHGPALSHHTGNIVKNALVLVGGWDGKNRSSKVQVQKNVHNGGLKPLSKQSQGQDIRLCWPQV